MVLLLLLITSCSILEKGGEHHNREFLNTRQMSPDGYREHLIFLGRAYIRSPEISLIPLDKKSKRYLAQVYDRISLNNELLLKQRQSPVFHIIKDQRVFFFSLPGSQFFFSSGLVARYFRNEEILATILTHEMIKSIRKVYQKKTIVPTGYIQTVRMLFLTKLPLKVKMEVNKWTYFAMKRSGYDPESVLQWMQTQNKNTFDFKLQYVDSQEISREEFLFKNFMATEKIGHKSQDEKNKQVSSQDFYHLVEFVKNKT